MLSNGSLISELFERGNLLGVAEKNQNEQCSRCPARMVTWSITDYFLSVS